MNVSDIGITEITEVPPPLDLTPEEIEGLADELIAYHAEFVDLYYRVEQAHWTCSTRGLLVDPPAVDDTDQNRDSNGAGGRHGSEPRQ